MKCKCCGTEPNNATTKNGLYVCCCYMLHLENGKYTQYHRDKDADHPAEKGGAEQWTAKCINAKTTTGTDIANA